MVNCIYIVEKVVIMDEKMNINLKSMYNTNYKNDYLYVYEIGTQDCLPDKPVRTHVFECTTLHFVVEGEGYFDGQLVKPGEGFVVREGEIATYGVNPENPWTYYWINITGEAVPLLLNAIGVHETKGVFQYNQIQSILDVFQRAFQRNLNNNDRGTIFLSYLFEIISILELEHKKSNELGKQRSVAEEHYKSALSYMANNYYKKMTIEEVAKFENIERHYLDRLFLMYSGKSPIKHLLEIRMERAGILLRTSNYPIGVIASSVGYSDQFQFSKAFKKYMNISPTEYREKRLLNSEKQQADMFK